MVKLVIENDLGAAASHIF